MKTALLLLVVVCGASSSLTTFGQSKIVRVPKHDSAIIQNHRLGGNFAYSVHEAHAYGVETPIVEQKVVPKGVTYHKGEPIVNTHTSIVKQKVPQFGVVRTQHTLPAVQYAAVSAPLQQVVTHQQVATPVQYSIASGQYAVPVQYATRQYSAAVPVQHGISQYSAAVPVQHGISQYSAAVPVHQGISQYSAAVPVQHGISQYSAAVPVQHATGHVQYVSSPVQFVSTGTAGAPVQFGAVSPFQHRTGKAVSQ